MPTRLVLYGKPGCHLCDDARAVLERVGAPFAEVDITTDDALHAAYLERIPVVVLDGVELLRATSSTKPRCGVFWVK